MIEALDDHRLRYLFEAVRHGSVRAAADGLDVNPSVVSRQIGQLEKDLGVQLIERLIPTFAFIGALSASWPGLSRPSTSLFRLAI